MISSLSKVSSRTGIPALVICSILVISSCALSQYRQELVPEHRLPRATRPAPHLAQKNFGHDAEFGLCMPPDCSPVTPKTMAIAPPDARVTTPQLPATASNLGATEAGKPWLPQTSATVISPLRPNAESTTKTVTAHFGIGDASLSLASKTLLDDGIAGVHDATQVVISGHTDSTGSAHTNEVLAAARARTAQDYLLRKHPRLAPVLKLEAQGACCYVAPNNTEQGRRLNRRVEVRITRDEASPL